MTVPAPEPAPEPAPTIGLVEEPVFASKPPTLTAAMIRSAMANIMAQISYHPPIPYTLSQHTHNRCNDLLGQPHHTPLTNLDVDRAASIEFAALSIEEQDAQVRLMWGHRT